MFWTTLLNCEDRCVQVLTRSMARSKFFTYSPYIFMNGASFCRMSPIRGLESLQPAQRANGLQQHTESDESEGICGNRSELVFFQLRWNWNYCILMSSS